MTNEELKQCSEAMIAFTEGKPVQYRRHSENDEVWRGIEKPSWDMTVSLYRPKPTPKRVPWSKPEHVPGPVVWLRHRDRTNPNASVEALLISVSRTGIEWHTNEYRYVKWSDEEKISKLEYSTDRLTWHPCEVEA